MVASEMHPFAKTGGLADVVGALPRALAKLGHDVDVVMPKYRGITANTSIGQITVTLGGQVDVADLSAVVDGNVRTIFVSHPPYFDREYLYGAASRDYPDNPERFAFLSQAAVSWASSTGLRYDIVHGHDWQAGLVPLMVQRTAPAWRGPDRPATVFTIHNLAYQGVFDASWLPRLGLGWDLMRVDALEYWTRISFLKGGIMFAGVITTVSPRYAEEIQTPELGFGFDGILRSKASDLVGILNGIDYDQWDPERDLNLPVPFSASKMAGKAAAKRRVLEAFGLPRTLETRRRPLVAMISRLVDQKGFDLLGQLSEALPALGASFVLLGSGEQRFETQWRELALRHPNRVGVRIGFDDALAHGYDNSHVSGVRASGANGRACKTAQFFNDTRQHRNHAFDILFRVGGAKAESNRILRSMRRQSHRLEYVRRLECARGTRRPRRDRNPFQVERNQQRLRLDAVEADVGRVGDSWFSRTVSRRARHPAEDL